MKEYPFFIDRYHATTQHLDLNEDLAYRRLLDVYYDREEPIPLDREATYRLIGAVSEDEQRAANRVLSEYFVKASNGYVNQFCESVIADFHAGKFRDRG